MRHMKAVSLSFELGHILDAIEGVRLLARPLQEAGADVESQSHHVVAGVVAALSLVVARLEIVISVVRGEHDPFWLLAPHNAVPDDKRQPDLLLRRWSAERVAEAAKATNKFSEAAASLRRRRR